MEAAQRLRLTGIGAIVVAALLSPPLVSAAVFVVPPDRKMIVEADAIFVGTVFSTVSRFDDDGEIVTDVSIDVETLFKGPLVTRLVLTEPGGVVGTIGRHVSGAPRYFPGERTLVFAERRDTGRWRTWGLEMGKFSFIHLKTGELVLVRGAGEGEIFGWDFLGRRHQEPLRHGELFLAYITAVVGGEPFDGGYIVEAPRADPEHPDERPQRTTVEKRDSPEKRDSRSGAGAASPEGALGALGHFPPSAYTMSTFRWHLFDTGGTARYRITGSQPGYDSAGAAQRALAAWTNDAGSNVRLALESGAGGNFERDGVNSIIFNSSTDVPAGAIGYAQVYSFGVHDYKGETFYTVVEGDAVMKSGLSIPVKAFEEAVTHEIGHTIALRHSDAAEPSSDSAVMRSVIAGNYGATLGPWDVEAVGHVYTASALSLAAPASVVATASSVGRVVITWAPVAGADSYRVERRASGGSFVAIATVTTTSFEDTSVQAGQSYLYRVIGVAGSSASAPSAPDLATTILFTDPTLTPGSTVIKAVHLTELRAAVNAVRALAGLGSASWTDPNPQGITVKAVHWTELRDRLNEARAALGLPTISFPSSVTRGAVIQAAHVQALRSGVT